MPSTAVQEYRARLDARRAARDALTAADARYANARLATFLSGVLIALLAWHPGIAIWWLLVPLAVFVWLVRRHDRVLRARELTSRGIEFFERGLARLEERWAGTGEPGERFRDDHHVYANDLDLFGRGSLFELLSLARTRTGEAMLAGWLTAPADPSEIQARQAAVEELASMLDLREQLALSGVEARASLDTDRLLRLGRVTDAATARASSRRLDRYGVRTPGHPLSCPHVGVVAAVSGHGVGNGDA